MSKIITNSEKETKAWAKKLSKQLTGGRVVSLEGNLGSGKTVIVKAVAKALGIKEIVNSPTFVLMKVYKVRSGPIKNLVHVDAYRLDGATELLEIGLADYLGQPDSLVLIEWGDKVKEILPSDAFRIKIAHRGGSKREISVK